MKANVRHDKKTHISITLTESSIRDMKLHVSQGQISKYIQELVDKDIHKKNEIWAQAFREASQDKERLADIAEWDKLVGIDEGLNAENDY